MNNIYVEELPETLAKSVSEDDVNTTEVRMWFKADVKISPLSDRLAEERKKVLWEIRKRAKRTQIYIKPTEKSPTGKEKCFVYEVSDDFLDQIERGGL